MSADVNDAPRPIFIIGAPRSGTSVTTWCIGQHHNVAALEETSWIAVLGLGLRAAYQVGTDRGDRSHLSAEGIERHAFMARFGRTVHELVREAFESGAAKYREMGREDPLTLQGDPPQPIALIRRADDPKLRWVDGTPFNSMHAWGLHLMFPEARWVHIPEGSDCRGPLPDPL